MMGLRIFSFFAVFSMGLVVAMPSFAQTMERPWHQSFEQEVLEQRQAARQAMLERQRARNTYNQRVYGAQEDVADAVVAERMELRNITPQLVSGGGVGLAASSALAQPRYYNNGYGQYYATQAGAAPNVPGTASEAWDNLWKEFADPGQPRNPISVAFAPGSYSEYRKVLDASGERFVDGSAVMLDKARSWTVIAKDLQVGPRVSGVAKDVFKFTASEVPAAMMTSNSNPNGGDAVFQQGLGDNVDAAAELELAPAQ